MNTPIAEEYRQQAEALADQVWKAGNRHGPDAERKDAIKQIIATALQAAAEAGREQERAYKDAAYSERNKLVRLLASLYPSGIKQTAIDGWDEAWHWCVYIDMPNGQASWHFHISDLPMFADLPAYAGEWDGHSTEQKYANILALASHNPRTAQQSEAVIAKALGNHLAVVQEGA